MFEISPEKAAAEKEVCDDLVLRIMTGTRYLEKKSGEATPAWRGPAYNAFAASVDKFAKNANELTHSIQELGECLVKAAAAHDHE